MKYVNIVLNLFLRNFCAFDFSNLGIFLWFFEGVHEYFVGINFKFIILVGGRDIVRWSV